MMEETPGTRGHRVTLWLPDQLFKDLSEVADAQDRPLPVQIVRILDRVDTDAWQV
jgi:hypothetical protein